MSATVLPAVTAAPPQSLETCFHCGLPIPEKTTLRISFNGQWKAVCCVGCEAVANTIVQSGLGHYYRERSAQPGQVALPPPIRDHSAYDLPAVSQTYLTENQDGQAAVKLYIEGITCAACVWLAETTLQRTPGVSRASVNQTTHQADIRFDNRQTNLSTLIDTLARIGLGAAPASAALRQTERLKWRRQQLQALGIALLSMMQVMMFTVPLYFTDPGDVTDEAKHLMDWASLFLTLPVVLYSAQTFYRGAWRDIRARHIGMDTPVALAIVATFSTSLWALLAGAGSLYFDAIAMFVFLLLAARYLESGVREQALSHIERLANAAPAVALRLTHYPHDRQSETVATASLQSGDTILVATGQTVAADGNIIEGDSEFDEALLTGEARPMRHSVGERVWGGSQNCASPVIVRVTGVGAGSLLAQIGRLTEEAAQQRSLVSGYTERIARLLAPTILLLAAAAALLWLWIDPRQSFNVLVAVLAVSCPCAIALAAPAAYAAAAYRLATQCLLISRSHVLATATHISDVIFDKTGTLTTGTLTLTRVQPLTGLDEATVLALAAALEKGAAHPIARAITTALAQHGAKIAQAHQLRLVAGRGVEGIIENRRYRFGTASFIREIAPLPVEVDVDSGAWVLAQEGETLATFEASDPLRDDAVATVQRLQAMGLQIHLLSGDQPARVQAVAAALGIETARVCAALLPAEKLAYLNSLKANGATTLMVGDGVNDAPVLAAADISLVMGGGADLTRLAADSVLLSPHLAIIADTLSLARRSARIITQNFAWALAYNAVAIPLAMANRVTPAEAAIGMAVSSLVVVVNSLRVGRRLT